MPATTLNPTSSENAQSPSAGFVERCGEQLFEIRQLEEMPPFLMTVVGDTDLWMYIASTGSFTAGRVEPDRCIFPYETDDRLLELGGLTGPITLIRFDNGRIWRPFDTRPSASSPSRVLRRTPVGDMVEFEETDADTGLRLRVEYRLCDELGVARRTSLWLPPETAGTKLVVLDGYRNIMPANVPLVLQQSMSTLVDAYKRSELFAQSGPAIYTLEAAISDSPQAKESLRVNCAWHAGLVGSEVFLSDGVIDAFLKGETAEPDRTVTGRRGAYLCQARIELEGGAERSWTIVVDAHLDHAAVVRLADSLASDTDQVTRIDASLARDREGLARLLADADACQVSADHAAVAAHQSNVLFNAMRGGVPIDGHRVDAGEFRRFVQTRNFEVAQRHRAFLDGLEPTLLLDTLAEKAGETRDRQLERIALEYLPLTFGRRHGDPSRPWNRYRIRVRDDQGKRVTGYEGNWRDIFQNWEATCRSYPSMLPGVVTKFLNATTAEGYNPYRINERGIDWEVPEPHNPRSGIGYWGDHQIVYLHRLLEQCAEVHPEWLRAMSDKPVFSYAEVPYRFKPFDEIASNPRDSLVFDEAFDTELRARAERIGGDGCLRMNGSREPELVTLLEKLLVPALAKVANLVPGGGIWMNTQRPEWNDANNALAGYGLSMVTLYQLRRYADWCVELIDGLDEGEATLSGVVAEWCTQTNDVLVRSLEAMGKGQAATDTQRWEFVSALGNVAERARNRMNETGLGARVAVDRKLLGDFFRLVRHACDNSIATARRPDGLYESYRVLHQGVSRAGVEPLAPMLEGQVAILASGVLDEAESIDLLDTLFDSELYREDQRTFILYPMIELPPFGERNAVPEEALAQSPLLTAALGEPSWALVRRDASGVARFDADLTSHEALQERIDRLTRDSGIGALVSQDGGAARHAFERTFRHARFTGRSGTMHKYEGLGSVYWHMVSKLLLSVQETVFAAVDRGAPTEQIDRLRQHYWRIRDGLGFRKSPREFGAIPHEPYSHTPWGMGAQQPGMTGQVKEGVLARFGEVGLRLEDGCLQFDPSLIDPAELLTSPQELSCDGATTVEVPAGGIGFSLCGVPITVSLGTADRLELRRADQTTETIDARRLPIEISRGILRRDGAVIGIGATLAR
ncbi:MAG: hypothetical protein AAGB51_01160 [Planctomycetota bacterium]